MNIFCKNWLLTQNFFQVKLTQPGLEFTLWPGSLPLPPRPQVFIFTAASTFARGSFCLWSRKVEDRKCLFLRPTSRRYGEGEGMRSLGVSSGGGEVQIFKSRPCTYRQKQAVHHTPCSHLLCQMPGHPPGHNKSSGLMIMRPIARSHGGNCSFLIIRARWEHHSDL